MITYHQLAIHILHMVDNCRKCCLQLHQTCS